MEALALLCTLHADGPATLQRLRRGGCPDLAAVEALPAEELARLVGISASAARRLAREATLLRERLAPGDADALLDQEEAPEILQRSERPTAALDGRDRDLIRRVLARPVPEEADPAAGPEGPEPEEAVAAAAAPAPAPVAAPAEPVPSAPEQAATSLDQGGQSQEDASLESDGNLPGFEEEAIEDEAIGDEATEEEATAEEPTAEAAMTDAMADRAIPGLQGTPLEPGTVDGLGSTELAVLADEGITTLEELGAADVGTCARATGLPFSSVARWVFLARRGGQLPAAPAADAPFGTGVMEAESPESEPIGTAELAVEPLELEDTRSDAPKLQEPAEEAASDAFGACVFDEPRSTSRPEPRESAPEPPAERPVAAVEVSEPAVLEPALPEPALPESALPESALPESALPDAVLPEQPHGEEPAPKEACRPEAPAAPTDLVEAVDTEPTTAPEPARMEAFEAPQPIQEDPTVRPPFWQVRAEWRAQGSKPEAAPTEALRSAAADQAAAGHPHREPAIPAPLEEVPSGAPEPDTAEAAAPSTAASVTPPPSPAPEDASLGWDFVIPSGPASPSPSSEERPRVDAPAEGIGGPFA